MPKEKEENLHKKHRERLRKRFLNDGIDNLHDHEILELLLCYAMPRIDVNEKGHRLIKTFHGFDKVFDAPVEELSKVEGIGEITAILIKLVPLINRRYITLKTEESGKKLASGRDAGRFILPYFCAEQEETVYMLTLDGKGRKINCRLMFRGSFNSAALNMREIIRLVLLDSAEGVIIAHNHPGGIAVPSIEDKNATHEIWRALLHLQVKLIDHIIVADDDFTSMSDSGYFDFFVKNG